MGGQLGAFLAYPTHYAHLLACTFPLLLCFYTDKKLRGNPLVEVISVAVTVLGLWSLWKTGSRGGMIALFAGGLSVFALFCYFQKQGRLFRNGVIVGVAVVAVVLLIGIQDGNRQGGDSARVRMWQASYAMWQDHKLLGVGLENWQHEYANKYILKDEIKKAVRQQYLGWKKEEERRVAATQKSKPQLTAEQMVAAKRAEAKRDEDSIAEWQKVIIKQESAFDMPHNVIAWFFSTTGIIGGIGYCLFYIMADCFTVN